MPSPPCLVIFGQAELPALEPWLSAWRSPQGIDLIRIQPSDTHKPWQYQCLPGLRLLDMQGKPSELLAQMQARVQAWHFSEPCPLSASDWARIGQLSQVDALLEGHFCQQQAQAAGFVNGSSGWRYVQAQGPVNRPLQAQQWLSSYPAQRPGTKVAVLGAGIAGCMTARALAEHGLDVQLFEQEHHICQAASGNRQGVLYIKPSLGQGQLARFQAQAWRFSLALLQNSGLSAEHYQAPGLILLGANPDIANNPLYQGQLFAIDRQQAQKLSGWAVPQGGLWLPQAAWVEPRAWAQERIQHPGIRLHLGQRVSPQRHDEGWQLAGQFFDQLVICAGAQSRNLAELAHLRIQPIQGWVSTHQLSQQQQGPKVILCAKGYATPALAGQLHFGASYGLNIAEAQQQPTDNAHNLERLAELGAEFQPKACELGGRAGVRAATQDTMPHLGPVALAPQDFGQALLRLKYGAVPPRWQPGLWLNLGHGSRGLSTAALSAYLLAAQMTGAAMPVPQDLFLACQPERQTLKKAKQQ